MEIHLLPANSSAFELLFQAMLEARESGRDFRFHVLTDKSGDSSVMVKVGGGMWSPPYPVENGAG